MRYALVAMMTLMVASISVADEKVMILDENTSVAPWTGEYSFTVPPFSIEHQVRLNLEARIDAPRLMGSNHWLRVLVNGTLLTEKQLLNKTNAFKLVRGLDMLWIKSGRLRILYSPDFEAAIKDTENGYSCPDADPYHFVFDITQCVQPGDNTLRLEHLKVLQDPSTMIIRNVFAEVGRPITAPQDEEITPAPTGPLTNFVPTGAQDVAMRVSVSDDGAISVTAAGREVNVMTRTSLPNGLWHEPAMGQPQRLMEAGNEFSVEWETGTCSVHRTVTVGADCVGVADTISNPGAELIGVIIEHRASSDAAPSSSRVAGRETYGTQQGAYNPANPSAYGQWPEMGLGLVAEDDIMRIHNRSFREADEFGISDISLGLEGGASVTEEWSIYPTPGGDYWDFVNAVRRNWGSNFTIPGPFTFNSGIPYDADATTLGKWMRDRSLQIICGGIAQYSDLKYAHGTGILFAPEWVAREKHWVQAMQQGAPEVWQVCYFHSFCGTEPDGETKYADSRMINTAGEHIGYPYRYRLPLYVPTSENSYGKALWGYVDTILDEIGAAGVYWDEMSHSVLWFAEDMAWDGCSVTMNRSTHEVIGKTTSVPLISQPLRLAIARHVRERGKFLMGNSQPATRTMHDEKIVRFVETGSYSAVDNTHLECPLGLGNHHFDDSPAKVAEIIRNILAHGATWYGHHYLYDPPEWDFGSVMFPITPVEIRAGMVIGEERIHTAQSGRFGFADGAAADVYVVGGDGLRVADPDVTEVIENGAHLYDIRMPGDQFAVLVRK